MFSKPLFKQSCKANFITWLFVTVITCIMIAMVIIILGTLKVNSVQTSMMNILISDTLESTIEEYSMKSYAIADTTLKESSKYYEEAKEYFESQSANMEENEVIIEYNELIASGITDSEARNQITSNKSELEALAINLFIDYYLIHGDMESSEETINFLISSIVHKFSDDLIQSGVSETTQTTLELIVASIDDYLNSTNKNVQDFANQLIPNIMSEVFYLFSVVQNDKTIYVSDYFTKDAIYETSYTSIVSYRAQMAIREEKLWEEFQQTSEYETMTEEERQEYIDNQLSEYEEVTIINLSESLLGQLPEAIANSLTELVEMDVYGLVIGSLFYKIAGLLLPIIYVIMVANNLLASQVDNGSMAYVLSTPTKRSKVTFTQMTFLTLSLFAMFALLTITSVISLLIVSGGGISISIPQILLLNLGAFLTVFALSGICFLASSWFNQSKYALGIGGGISMFFLVTTILGLFGSSSIPQAIRIESMNYFNYFTIITLFDTTSILAGTLDYLWKFGVLALIGLITYLIGMIKFNKKDLPL